MAPLEKIDLTNLTDYHSRYLSVCFNKYQVFIGQLFDVKSHKRLQEFFSGRLILADAKSTPC